MLIHFVVLCDKSLKGDSQVLNRNSSSNYFNANAYEHSSLHAEQELVYTYTTRYLSSLHQVSRQVSTRYLGSYLLGIQVGINLVYRQVSTRYIGRYPLGIKVGIHQVSRQVIRFIVLCNSSNNVACLFKCVKTLIRQHHLVDIKLHLNDMAALKQSAFSQGYL